MAPAPALWYLDANSNILASHQKNLTKVTFSYQLWHIQAAWKKKVIEKQLTEK